MKCPLKWRAFSRLACMSVLRSIEYVTPHERGIAWQRNSTR